MRRCDGVFGTKARTALCMFSSLVKLYRPPRRLGGLGFSLVECLIANALILVMIGALISASLDVVVTTQLSAERSDQSLRLRQLRHYLDATVATARMPPEWSGHQSSTTVVAPWQMPAAPCESPSAVPAREHWGGLDLIDLDEAPCVPGTSTGQGLYVERVLPCPSHCEPGPGYRVVPAQCHTSQLNETASGSLWRVDWQPNLSPPEHCPEGTPWGRLDRLIVSYRAASHSGSAAPELRIQSLTQGPEYGWGSAETLVAGITDWQVDRINDSPTPTAGSSGVEKTHSSVDGGAASYFQLGFSIISLNRQFSAPPLRLSQLLAPRR